ncbi:hypothetical protein ACU686_44190 [Yinghuangia aomiensis]
MIPGSGGLPGAAAWVRDAAAGVRLPLDLPGADEARRTRRELVAQLDDYVLPRLRHPDAPLVAAFVGSTGTGRSTLVNALTRRVVSPPGVLRPTTHVPVLVCRAADRHWFAGARMLPGLRRIAPGPRGEAAEPALVLQIDERVPAGMALLDVPDPASVAAVGDDLAVRHIAAADIWVFTTTAERYADAVPWHLLRVARERDVELAVVLNRVPADDLPEVQSCFAALLGGAGARRRPVFPVPETDLAHGLLARDADHRAAACLAVRPGHRPDDARRRRPAHPRRRARERAPARPGRRTRRPAAARRGGALATCVTRTYSAAVRQVAAELAGGAVFGGELAAAWERWAAAGLPTDGARRIEDAVVTSVGRLVQDVVEGAAEHTADCWAGRPGGEALRPGGRAPDGVPAYGPALAGLAAAGPGPAALAAAAAEAWRTAVLDGLPEGTGDAGRALALLLVAAVTPEDRPAGAAARAALGPGVPAARGSRGRAPGRAADLAGLVAPASEDLRARAETVVNTERERHRGGRRRAAHRSRAGARPGRRGAGAERMNTVHDRFVGAYPGHAYGTEEEPTRLLARLSALDRMAEAAAGRLPDERLTPQGRCSTARTPGCGPRRGTAPSSSPEPPVRASRRCSTPSSDSTCRR